MKITAIRAFPVWVGIRNQLLVKVETDEGIFGWGESGLSGREKAVVGAVEHFRRIRRRPRPDAHRRALAGDVPQPVFRGRPGADGGDLGDRHRAPRHQGQGARRAGLRSARRQAARPHPDLRLHARAARAGDDRAGKRARPPRLDLHAPLAGRPPEPGDLRAARAHRGDGARLRRGARGARRRRRAGHRLPPPPVGRRGGEFLPENAARHARLPRGADPRRDAGGLRVAAPADRHSLRHRRGIFVANGSSCPTSSAASTSSTASTSAMSAASPRR